MSLPGRRKTDFGSEGEKLGIGGRNRSKGGMLRARRARRTNLKDILKERKAKAKSHLRSMMEEK